MQMPFLTVNLISRARLALAIAAAVSLLWFSSSGHMGQSAAQDNPEPARPVQDQRNQNQPRQGERRPVLVELFTSEGCSDCPPADALLALLDGTQYIAGAEAIVMSEHVTYFNEGGWRDPFSSDAFTQRQQAYSRQFQLGYMYTPQMVVDGAEQFVGNDAAKLDRAVAKAATVPKLDLQIANIQREADGSIVFAVHVPAVGKEPLVGGSVVAAIALNQASSAVRRGENAAHTLKHVAVARFIKEFGSSAVDGRQLRLAGAELKDAEKSGVKLRLVVFLVNGNGRVVGAAEQTLPSEPSTPSGSELAAVR
jgi:hypothetical protein